VRPGKHPNIRIDMYSCGSVNWRKAVDIAHEHFNFLSWRATFIDRQIESNAERMILEIEGKEDEVIHEKKLTIPGVALIGEKVAKKNVKQTVQV